MEGRNVINIHRLTELVIITCTPGIEGNSTVVEQVKPRFTTTSRITT